MAISLVSFIYTFFYRVFLSEGVEYFILNKMSHQEFESDQYYRFFMVRIDRQIVIFS